MRLLWQHQSGGHGELEFDDIDGQIFVGTNACCRTHFAKVLLDAGITADISLEAEHLDTPFGAEMFLWLPVEDHSAPTPEQLRVGVAALSAMIIADRRVYVHCMNGHGRAPTLVAAYYISRGFALEESIKKIQVRRPSIHLENSQLSALQRFADACRT